MSSSNYYNKNSTDFFEATIDIDMEALYKIFLDYLPLDSGRILDAGCGSGRDAKYFMSKGFVVDAFDASEEMVRLSSKLLGQTVELDTFETFSSSEIYKGIWACASLLHVPMSEMKNSFRRLRSVLSDNGVLYASFKYGTTDRIDPDRTFTCLTEELLLECDFWSGFSIEKSWVTSDLRENRSDEKWLNTVFRKDVVGDEV